MKYRLKTHLLFLSISLLLACGSGDDHAGATTEATNGLSIVARDSAGSALSNVRLVAYASRTMLPLDSARTGVDGKAVLRIDSAHPQYYLEAIQGVDSAMMGWIAMEGDSEIAVHLTPSANLTVRSGAANAEQGDLPNELRIAETPYKGRLQRSDFVFGKVPAGMHRIVRTDRDGVDSIDVDVGSINLEPGAVLDTLIEVDQWTRSLLFENFDDGDSKHLYSAQTGSQGWYINSSAGSTWISPLSTAVIEDAITTQNAWSGKSLALRFTAVTGGTLLLGTHLGVEQSTYDLSSLSAIRLRVRGDARFAFALEQPTEVEPGKYNKVLWNIQAQGDWQEVVLRPDLAELNAAGFQIAFDAAAPIISLLTLFVWSGSWLEIDEIVFEGLDSTVFSP